ncbi:beta-ketoacyl synthase N-terminal-like domain-containing protein [uncultured Hyphomonas sp.]|uniref:beta-ketoacyl synthase N-terminal-like domain-containing protein n=1 Tax=uncultured Hyphomonas sp. TaxID=225298 RepID=UPI0030DBED3A
MTSDCRFEPIAIVGQGCVLPGAMSPAELGDLVFDKRVVYGPVPSERLGLSEADAASRNYVSGTVQGFEHLFDEARIPEEWRAAAKGDPVCAWSLHAAIEAWTDARKPKVRKGRSGVFVANLSYPSAGHADYAARHWAGQGSADPLAPFNSSLPPYLIAQALGLSGPAFSLDAACASSLYALEIACRRLQSQVIDCAVVVGVNAADNLILHIGFDALKALSPTGQSRPFVKGADGLVPSEGAVSVVLKRLSDVKKKDVVHGIIRGIGLSNDGRRKGLLAPSGEGQTEAMTRAYTMAGVDPKSVSYLECHATGTPTGDGVEVQASADMFADNENLAIGSLKANTGHLITAAGLASLLKLTEAFKRETLPPTPIRGDLIEVASRNGLKVLDEAAPWEPRDGLRRAAISNFGFGGNNAHLVLDQYDPGSDAVETQINRVSEQNIVICGTGLLAGSDRGADAVTRRIMNQPLKPAAPCRKVGADPKTARTPPTDLLEAEPQQLAIVDVVEEALQSVAPVASDRVGIFTAMGCASDSARWLLRERLASLAGLPPNSEELATAQARIAPPLQAATVLGAMANMTANRVTYAHDFQGMGFAVSAESASGLAALDLAIEALRLGQLDMAIVAAADFATEPVRAAALADIGITAQPGDQAAAIVLKRKQDAEAASDRTFGSVHDVDWSKGGESDTGIINRVFGTAPCASVVFELALQAQLCARGHVLTAEGAVPDIRETSRPIDISVEATPLNTAGSVKFHPADAVPIPDALRPTPFLFWASAKDKTTLAARVASGKTGGRGKCRIAMVAPTEEALAQQLDSAQQMLEQGKAPVGDGVHYGEGKPSGELAFMFTGSAAVYPRMGRGLLSAFPELRQRLAKLDKADEIAPLLAKASLTEFEQLCAGTLMSQAHAILLLDILGLKPDAALGLSLGESNALFAFGFWRDPGALLDEISDAAMYERHIGGEFETAKEAWGPNVPADWTNWRVQAPVDAVKREVAKHTGVEITIIYSRTDCMIGGPAEACRKICEALGPGSGAKMHQHLIVHAKAMRPFAETWRKLHTRKMHDGGGVRLYANAINAAYEPTSETSADMLTRQAVDTVDFPPTVEQAWKDGVRTFVELGPRDTLTAALGNILEGKDYKAVATDRIETADLGQVADLAAFLFADGRAPKMKPVSGALEDARRNRTVRPAPWALTRDVPYATPIVPALTSTGRMPVAPILAAVNYPAPCDSKTSTTPVPFPAPPTDRPLPGPRKVTAGTEPLLPRSPAGPHWNYPEIEKSAREKMSDFFGAAFKPQDQYARQVRLPAPPLLLVDRITGIDAEAGVESTGVIWTETDLKPDQWFIHDGRIRPGPLIESGQADLTLIGWMGADFKNQDDRVYRLLGCEITFHEGGLPQPGETLRFQIEITGHATLAGVRMFFFQYDCMAGDRRVFSVRNGQAGFFSDEELASGKGVMWDPAKDAPPTADPAPFAAEGASRKRAFSARDLDAYRDGNAWACFGDGFELAAAQSRPMRLPDDRLALFDDVEAFDPNGGPWGRGYLKARAHVPVDAWFYEGHFHNDPCMPGTLMAEAAVQTLEFYAAAAGLLTERDGYVFEPMPGHMAQFVCRGQVIPDTDHDVTYEVFIDEIVDGETPEIYASLLASSDGKKVFYCPRFGLRLRRDWPAPRIADTPIRTGPMGESRGDHAALLDCANGAPSAAFGEMYDRFDTEGIVPRLPQEPYHMMTRVIDVSTRPGVQEVGAKVRAEYDIPANAWYFEDNRNGAMPFAVLSEIALQPCGWLASHCGFALSGNLKFRNLEGDGVLHRELRPGDGTMVVESELTAFSRVGPMTIVTFSVVVTLASGEPVLDLTTQFGFFPAAALVRQAGLSAKPHFSAAFDLPGEKVKTRQIEKRLPGGKMRMLDTVDYFNPTGGEAGLGLIRGRQAVDPNAWYFKAHFYQDPVQPGSLGLDALAQLLARAILLKGLDEGMSDPHFETIATGAPFKWSYRGQVTPDKKEVVTVMEIVSMEERDKGWLVTARGSLWRDGLRVYEVGPYSLALVDRG